MTEQEAFVAFNLADRIGSARVEELRLASGSVAAAWENCPNKVSRTGGEVEWKREFEKAKRYGVTILTPADADYPSSLREAPGHPLALYIKGNVKALSNPSIALIGTRRATSYGLNQANKIAYDLAKSGWTIVSGLAMGIDAESHRGALAADGVTVGVIGSGLDEFYPLENRDLAREMVKKGGAVVSEFPFGRKPDQTTFPIRNHVVAALARGVVAVEAPVKSGTLITTSIAADLGRTVMAVPARVDNRMSGGCLSLIRDGAILVRHADDVMDAMGEFLPRTIRKDSEANRATAPEHDVLQPRFSVEESLVMLHIDEDGVSMDELATKTRLPIDRVNALAMALRIKGFVKFLPGNRISLLTGRV